MSAVIDTSAQRFGRFELCIAQRQLLVGGLPGPLGARAFDVLLALVSRRDRVVPKAELLEAVWPGLVVEEDKLQVQISALRKVLGPASITTVPGRGYQFTLGSDEPEAAALGQHAGAPPSPVPTTHAGIFGRDADLPALKALLLEHRLVTITGAGGIGKTVLAQALARQMQPSFEDGVRLIELAPLTAAEHVLSTVAGALQITLGPGAALPELAGKLGARRMLLVLDNCEHLLAEVAALADAVLRAAPQVHLLITSQAPLRLSDEWLYRLDPLALPRLATLELARSAGAVMLFEARAQSALPGFALSSDNVAAVVDICSQLDGLALAIELAAARVPLLGIEGLRARLSERLRLLQRQTGMALPRHQTLRAALEWSHGLLTPVEQVVFRRLGVASGSFGLGAAQQMAADFMRDANPGGAIDEWAVLDHLGALVDKSLVVAEPDGGGNMRFRLLETMRHLAIERLDAAGEAAAVRGRHLAFYLALAEQAKPLLSGPQQGDCMAGLDAERDNLIAAHAWCEHAPGGARQGLQLVAALDRYWLNRGLMTLGQQLGAEALARPLAQARDRLRCEALGGTGWLCFYRGQFDQARAYLLESVAIGREIGADGLVASTLIHLGNVFLHQAELAAARDCMAQALALRRQIDDEPSLLGSVLTSLGEVERIDGHLAAALPLYQEALVCARRAGDRLRIMIGLNNLAMVAAGTGDVPAARQMQLESLSISDELGSRRGRLMAMEVCAGMVAMGGQAALAARWDGAAEVHTLQMGRHRDPADETYLRPLIEQARVVLSAAAFEQAQQAGRALPYDEAVAEVRRWLA